MEEIIIDGYKFIKVSLGDAQAIFSTAENALDFNKSSKLGIENLENIKNWFKIDKVGHMNQVHGDSIVIYDEKVHEADAIVTNLKKTAVGVFTADCVPILLYDKENKVIAAVHSGWKGTLECILLKTIEKMEKEFGTNAREIIACIGPHNHECCYEVGEEIITRFLNTEIYKNIKLSVDRNLSMKACLMHQLLIKGIKDANIYDASICTFCSESPIMHSYRKSKDGGRMFSFIFLK